MNTDDVPCWHQLSAAMITQVGDVYRIVVPLPHKVEGRYVEIVISGIGIDSIGAAAQDDPNRAKA